MHIITGLGTGGAERALYNVVVGGLGERYENIVVSLGDEGTFGEPLNRQGIRVYALRMSYCEPPGRTLWRLSKIVHDVRPDILQGWMYHGNMATSLAAWTVSSCPPIVWNVRQTLYSLANEKALTRQVIRVNRHLSSHVDKIVYNSHVSRRQHEALGFAQSCGHVIPNGFDVEMFAPNQQDKLKLRSNLNLSIDVLIVGHVARFHPMKDHISFLRAAVWVARKLPKVRFVLAGRDVNLENSALTGIVPPELSDRFVFLGERNDIQRLMQSVDVLVTSSAWGEGFPNVLGEAMASGVPYVTTDVGDSATIVADTGIVVPPADSQALARGLLDMLGKSEEERRALGRAARERVERQYKLDRVVAQYAGLYSELVDRGANE